MLKFDIVNEYLWKVKYSFQNENFFCDFVHLHDRIMVSGSCGHQVFKGNMPIFPDFFKMITQNDRDFLKKLCVLHTEGTVNKERASKNVDLIPDICEERRKILKQKILDCDCSPTTMRTKLKTHFGFGEKEISLLNLEDENKEMTSTVDLVKFVAHLLIDGGMI